MRVTFISFTGMAYGLNSGRITLEDLAGGTFHFGCSAEHIFCPPDKAPMELTWLNEDRSTHCYSEHLIPLGALEPQPLALWTALLPVLRQAHAEGRMTFKKDPMLENLSDLVGPIFGHNRWIKSPEECKTPQTEVR